MAKKKGSTSHEDRPEVQTASFFHKIQPIPTFMHMKAPRRDKKDKRQVTITFRMALDGNRVRSAPDFIQTAYVEVETNGADAVSLRKVVSGVDIQIFESDKLKRSGLDLSKVNLEKLAVKEINSSKGDASIVLTFEVLYPWEGDVWRFLGHHYASQVFLKFDAEQASLLDLEDSEPDAEETDDGQEPLNMEDAVSGKDAAAGDTKD